MNTTNNELIEFAKDQCEIFPEDSHMGKYLRETMKMLQAEQKSCGDVPDTNVGNKKQAEPCEDAVSREDVIKAIDRHTFNTDDGLCLDEDISIILEELPSVKFTQGWIPVSERLPEEETNVLVCNAKGNVEISMGSYSTELKNHFDWYISDWWFGKVVAWVSLPKPSKAESEVEND